MPSAHQNSELRYTTYSKGCEPKMFWNEAAAGMNTCVPASRCSVMPFRRKSMPRVVMNDGTRRNVVITPLVSPTRQDTASAASIADPDREPVSFGPTRRRRRCAGARAYTRPSARSISPQIRSIV